MPILLLTFVNFGIKIDEKLKKVIEKFGGFGKSVYLCTR